MVSQPWSHTSVTDHALGRSFVTEPDNYNFSAVDMLHKGDIPDSWCRVVNGL